MGLITFFAQFAVDADGLVSSAKSGEHDMASRFEIRLATHAWSQVRHLESDEVCSVWFDLEGQRNAPWAADDGLLFGVDVPSPAVGGHDCHLFDLSGFRDEDPFAHFSDRGLYGSYSFGIGGPALDEVIEVLDPSEELAGVLMGGRYDVPMLREEEQPKVYGVAYAVDPETMEVVVEDDDLVPVDPASLADGSGIRPALFRLTHAYVYRQW